MGAANRSLIDLKLASTQKAAKLTGSARTMTKPVLLLLPGLLCDEANWAAQCADLAGMADCRVPAYPTLDSIEAMAEHVLATAPPGGFAMAGHSMGGRVALEVLRRAPERIERLALLDTGFQALAAGEAGEKERAGRHQLLALAQSEGMRAMGTQWACGMVHPSRLGTPVFEAILDMIARHTPAMFAAQIQALLARPDASALLPQIRCPTLLLCGRDDLWSPLVRHESMQRAIPGARLEVIELSGHMTTMEQPRAVSQALAQWLALRHG
ncbi:MAG: alpha/beta hydrolase fold [Polaromonas sp.]|nr:alpha/beta hydrolase fold [Polaromonas sp.]